MCNYNEISWQQSKVIGHALEPNCSETLELESRKCDAYDFLLSSIFYRYRPSFDITELSWKYPFLNYSQISYVVALYLCYYRYSSVIC